MLLQCYVVYGKENNWRYQVNEKSEVRVMRKVLQDELDKAAAVYIIALQQFVVRGVKHSSNGSEDFEVLFLRNMHLTENVGHVHQLLTHDLKLPQILASKIISIVTWAQELGLIAACGAFLKLYNKGTIPFGDALEAFQKHESFIQQNTYFGNLVEELYVLRKHSESMIDVNKSKVVKTLDVTQLPKVEVNSNEPFDLMALI